MSTLGAMDATVILSAKAKLDISDKMHLLEDKKARLATLVYSNPPNTAKVTNRTFSWLTDQIAPKADTLNGALNGTTLTVTTADFCKINDIVKIPSTGETVLVTARTTSVAFTVTRSWGAVAQDDTKTTGEPIINLGPAFPEMSGLRVSASNDTIIATTELAVQNTNYTQIWRHAVPISRTLQNTDVYAATNERLYQQMKKGLEHVRDQNLDAYFMEKNLTGNQSTSGGLYEFIASANKDTTATLTESAFNTMLASAFRYGDEELWMIMSQSVAQIVNEFASVNQRIQPGETKYGIRLQQFQSPHGLLNMTVDYALQDNATYKKYAFFVSKDEVRRRVMEESHLETEVQLPDVHGTVDCYTAEFGWEWGHGTKHCVGNSITS